MRLPRLGRAVPGFRMEAGERVLDSAHLDGGDSAVATTMRLVLVRADGVRWQRRWHEIDSATWDRDEAALAVQAADGERLTLRVPDGSNIHWATTVRERIQASVVTWRTTAVPRIGEVRVVARRRHNASLMLQVTVPPGRSASDPGVAQAVAGLRALLRDELGDPDL